MQEVVEEDDEVVFEQGLKESLRDSIDVYTCSTRELVRNYKRFNRLADKEKDESKKESLEDLISFIEVELDKRGVEVEF